MKTTTETPTQIRVAGCGCQRRGGQAYLGLALDPFGEQQPMGFANPRTTGSLMKPGGRPNVGNQLFQRGDTRWCGAESIQ